MAFEIEPKILIFSKTKNKSLVTIKNKRMSGAGFVFKTNTVDKYKIKPHIGVIIPLQDVEIEITALELDPKGKFVVEIYDFDWRRSVGDLRKGMDSGELGLICKEKINVVVSDKKVDGDSADIVDVIVCVIGVIGFLRIAKAII